MSKILLGQLDVEHILSSVLFPTQFSPALTGAGFVHDLARFCTPPPQVTEHALHVLQSDQFPSTEISIIKTLHVLSH